MKVIAGVPYVILMAPCDASYNITGSLSGWISRRCPARVAVRKWRWN